jgi:hypothetical protein
LVRLAATKLEKAKQVSGFHLIYVESFDERCYIPSIIYCMAIPSPLIDFIAQNIVPFEHTIQISLWARIIGHDGKIRKIPVQNFDSRGMFTALT